MKTYAEKLRDPRWQKKRLEIMERDEFCCTWCGDSESTLNVHHHYYDKGASPWEYPDIALTTLCEQCHKDVEEMRKEILRLTTWEVPLTSIHRLATKVDPFLLSEIALSLTGDNTPSAKAARARMANKVIEEFTVLLKDLTKDDE